jgi:hypothetical protein
LGDGRREMGDGILRSQEDRRQEDRVQLKTVDIRKPALLGRMALKKWR